MNKIISALACGLLFAISSEADETSRVTADVVEPRVSDMLCRVILNGQELGGEALLAQSQNYFL